MLDGIHEPLAKRVTQS